MRLPAFEFIFKKVLLRWVCVFLSVGILIVGLWPFKFFPKNRVEWLQDGNGIHFDGRGLVYGVGSNFGTSWRFQNRKAFTVELWLKPSVEPNRNLPVFLALYDRSNLNAIYFAQWRSTLIVRWKNLSAPLVFKEFGVGNALHANEKRFITITFDSLRTAVFIDGRLGAQHPANLLSPLDQQSTRWVLGSAPNGASSWEGDLFALALYGRSLSSIEVNRNYDSWLRDGLPSVSPQEGLSGLFTFREGSGEIARSQINPEDQFIIPGYFRPVRREILVLPWKDFQFKRSYLTDMAVNILGFIPFGFVFAAYFLRCWVGSVRKAFLATVLSAALLSVAIELIQAWIPSRDSQVMDLLMNTFGAALGAFAFTWLPEKELEGIGCRN